ncbi:MAG: hypothetical protein U1A78_42145 [Polyangia bacterium]
MIDHEVCVVEVFRQEQRAPRSAEGSHVGLPLKQVEEQIAARLAVDAGEDRTHAGVARLEPSMVSEDPGGLRCGLTAARGRVQRRAQQGKLGLLWERLDALPCCDLEAQVLGPGQRCFFPRIGEPILRRQEVHAGAGEGEGAWREQPLECRGAWHRSKTDILLTALLDPDQKVWVQMVHCGPEEARESFSTLSRNLHSVQSLQALTSALLDDVGRIANGS